MTETAALQAWPGLPAAGADATASPWLPRVVTIRDIKPETPGVVTYVLEFADRSFGEAYRFAPGQFNMLYLPGIGESAISISSDPADHGTLLHTVPAAGNVTQVLARKRPGDRLALRGPFDAQLGEWLTVAAQGAVGIHRQLLEVGFQGDRAIGPLNQVACFGGELTVGVGGENAIACQQGTEGPVDHEVAVADQGKVGGPTGLF